MVGRSNVIIPLGLKVNPVGGEVIVAVWPEVTSVKGTTTSQPPQSVEGALDIVHYLSRLGLNVRERGNLLVGKMRTTRCGG